MAAPTKVFIKIESSSEQQENLKNIRKQFKPLQAAVDKENLAGRLITPKNNLKAKLESEIGPGVSENSKRKKCETKSTQTDIFDTEILNKQSGITEQDLISDNPSEHYWELLAEKRRKALEETLEENRKLYERIESLEDELETSKKMIEEANGLVEVLTEMLSENENQESNPDAESQEEDENIPTTSAE